MTDRQNTRYEKLRSGIVEYARGMHERSKKRTRVGIIILVIMPFALEAIRRLTESDKVAFLGIWLLAMFLVCAYLISVEYMDHIVTRSVKDMTGEEEEFDGLLPGMDKTEDILKRLEGENEERS